MEFRRLNHQGFLWDIDGQKCGVKWFSLNDRQKIRNPAWNSLSEVMKDVCINFWVEVFGSECESMHTDNSVCISRFLLILEYICHFEQDIASSLQDSEATTQ